MSRDELSSDLRHQLALLDDREPLEVGAPEQLRADARLALDLAQHFAKRQEAFAAFIATEWHLEEWLANLPRDLARVGLADEAVAVGDALATLPHNGIGYASELALIIAEAGRAEEARRRTEVNLAELPDNPWMLREAGRVYAVLGDLDRAENCYREAPAIADDWDDPEEIHASYERLSVFLSDHGQ